MTEQPPEQPGPTVDRPKWFAPGVFALAFTLSYIGAEVMGPLGAILGLLLGIAVGWAGAKYVFTGARDAGEQSK